MTPHNEQIISLIETVLILMFPGTTIEDKNLKATKNQLLVSFYSPNQIAIKYSEESATRVLLRRSPMFSKEDRRFIECLIKEFNTVQASSSEKYHEALRPYLLKKSIARYLSIRPSSTIVAVLNLFEELAGRTYEGQNLSLAIGVVDDEISSSVLIKDYFKEDFSMVLSNGIHTIITCTKKGEIIGQESLNDETPNSRTPISYLHVANWSKSRGTAIVLNRNGEILIFHNGQLILSKRRQIWQFYSHDVLIRQIKLASVELSTAVYESSLDVSFGRTGGLIVLMKRNFEKQALANTLTTDLPAIGQSAKSKFLKAANFQSFNKLDRRIRMELLAIDGATFLDYRGVIQNAGSIITGVTPSPDGGARTAAARSMTNYGLAIKVSMDGIVKIYKNDSGTVKYIAFC